MRHSVAQSPCLEPHDPALFDAMKSLLSTLSEDELAAIEDDLDFCRFTGLLSTRIDALLAILAGGAPRSDHRMDAIGYAA